MTKEYPAGTFTADDKSPTRCQCVMHHETFIEGGIWQCGDRRDPGSNLFCAGCEELHGDYWRKTHSGETT